MNTTKAFTLIELLVCIAIAALFIGLMIGILGYTGDRDKDIDINPMLFPEAAAAQALQRMEKNSRK